MSPADHVSRYLGSPLVRVAVCLVVAGWSAPTLAIAQRVTTDSIAVERSSGFGLRAAYRVTVDRTGRVRFARRPAPRSSPGARTASGRLAPGAFQRLERRVERSGFFAMPREVRSDSTLCPIWRSDAPTVTIEVYGASQSRRVTIDEGCMRASGEGHVPKVQALLDLAAAVDSVAGTKRWLPRGR
jgi:hypothetical protein